VGTGGFFPRGKEWPGRDADHSPPSSANVKKEWEVGGIPPLPPGTSMACSGTALLYEFLKKGYAAGCLFMFLFIFFGVIQVPLLKLFLYCVVYYIRTM
jgi:hypothetical protein